MIDVYCILSAAVYCLSVGKSQNDSCLDEFGLQNVRHGFYLCAEVAHTPPPPLVPPLAPSWKCFPREVSRAPTLFL